MKQTDNYPTKIYLIQQSSGSYDTFTIHNLGFTYSKSKASKIVKKLNLSNNLFAIHPIAGDQYENEAKFYAIRNEFEELAYEWDEIENQLYDKRYQDPVPGYDETKTPHVYDMKLYSKATQEIEEYIYQEKVKWFENNEALQKFLPDGKTWDETLKAIETWKTYQSQELGDAFFEEIQILS